MSDRLPPPQRIAVGAAPNLPDAPGEAQEVARFLKKRGVKSVLATSLYDAALRERLEAHEFDVLIAMGGDGTMLRAGHLCSPLGIPILGINLGKFGFLMELQRQRWQDFLPHLIEGNYRLEKRMTLQASHKRGDKLLGTWQVINEAVVSRGQVVRPIRLKAQVDGYSLATFVADGLIAATATGSTAYSLAAGGPIMPPELRNILITPVAPHMSMDRSMILPAGACVTINAYTDHEAVLSLDGHAPQMIQNGDLVQVEASQHDISFVRLQDPGYFYRNLTLYMEQNPSADGV
ncbi:MAG: NAD(+)/NADH kinase [Anaerolineaceae bacterium]|nr:NAD(+)/NADH kinase [Anaerolineaceae bacterium]